MCYQGLDREDLCSEWNCCKFMLVCPRTNQSNVWLCASQWCKKKEKEKNVPLRNCVHLTETTAISLAFGSNDQMQDVIKHLSANVIFHACDHRLYLYNSVTKALARSTMGSQFLFKQENAHIRTRNVVLKTDPYFVLLWKLPYDLRFTANSRVCAKI